MLVFVIAYDCSDVADREPTTLLRFSTKKDYNAAVKAGDLGDIGTFSNVGPVGAGRVATGAYELVHLKRSGVWCTTWEVTGTVPHHP